MTYPNNCNDQTLREARDRFEYLIQSCASERDFQCLFSECPYIFSRALPLQLDPREIVPLGRPGKSEPDFLFYPMAQRPVCSYGAIELKKPDSRILTLPRKDTVCLSRDAATAVAQVMSYSQRLRERVFLRPDESLFIGSALYLFVIMGLSEEIAQKIANDVLRDQMANLLPPGCQILPYDELLRRFEATVPSKIITIVPDESFRRLTEVFLRLYLQDSPAVKNLIHAAMYADINVHDGRNPNDYSALAQMCDYLDLRTRNDIENALTIPREIASAFYEMMNPQYKNLYISLTDLLLIFLVGSNNTRFTVEKLVSEFGWATDISQHTLDASKELRSG